MMMQITRFPLFAPDKMHVALMCSQTLLMTGTATGGTTVAISLNSAYDPYVAAGGGKCTGFDQWAALYQRYIVRNSDHRARFVLQDSTVTDHSMIVGMVANSSANTFPSTPAQYSDWLIETPNSVWGRFTNIVNNTPYQVFNCKKSFDVAKIEGVSGPLDYVDYSGPVTADPTLQPIVSLVAALDSTSVATFHVSVNIESTYYVEFYERAGAKDASS
jgi:hypothetical protein